MSGIPPAWWTPPIPYVPPPSRVWCGRCRRYVQLGEVPVHCTPDHVGAEMA